MVELGELFGEVLFGLELLGVELSGEAVLGDDVLGDEPLFGVPTSVVLWPSVAFWSLFVALFFDLFMPFMAFGINTVSIA